MKWWKGSLWILMGLVLLLVVAASVYTTRAMPVVDGELRLAGLRQSVRVERDPHGIPTIKAQNLHDLMFALGFLADLMATNRRLLERIEWRVRKRESTSIHNSRKDVSTS